MIVNGNLLVRGVPTASSPLGITLYIATDNNDQSGKITVRRAKGNDLEHPQTTTPGSPVLTFLAQGTDLDNNAADLGFFAFLQIADAESGFIPGGFVVGVTRINGEFVFPLFAIDGCIALGNAFLAPVPPIAACHIVGVDTDRVNHIIQQAPSSTQDLLQFRAEDGVTILARVDASGRFTMETAPPSALTIVTPAEITADETDYDVLSADVLRLSSNASHTIVFLDGTLGRYVKMVNVGSNRIVLVNGGNMITGVGGDLNIDPNQWAEMLWDEDSTTWRVLGTNGFV